MTDDRIWRAEELEQLTSDERDRVVKEGIVTDLSQVSADFLTRPRAKGRALLEERGIVATERSGLARRRPRSIVLIDDPS